MPAVSSTIWASITPVTSAASEALAQASRVSVVMKNYTPHTTTATPPLGHTPSTTHATYTTMLNCSTLIRENRIACFSLLNETAYHNTLGLLWDEIDGSWLEFWVCIGNYVVFLVLYLLPVLVGCIYALSVGYVMATAIFGKRSSKRSAGASSNHAAEDVGGQMDGSVEQPMEQDVPSTRKAAGGKFDIVLLSPVLMYITLVVSAACGVLGSTIKDQSFAAKCVMAAVVLMPIGLVGVLILLVKMGPEKKKGSEQPMEMDNL
ncbi:hypothetical protein LTR17_021878 [Elasticomyces elasticus]|nr:hypothetical protein LTR17_021878 [Elasticomyces elasticus]